MTREQRIAAWIDEQIAQLPPLTDEQIARAAAIFSAAHHSKRLRAAG